jgi:hypothetical protein
MASLILGGVIFKHFEIPSRLTFPMAHRYNIHKQVGGGRVVDAMGQDPQPRQWAGRFTGVDATPRARMLEQMTAQGRELPLVYGSFMNMVLIILFEPDMERTYDIPYRIVVLPTRPIGGGQARGADAGAAIAGDMAAVLAQAEAAARIQAETEAP